MRANRVELSGRLLDNGGLRHTPSGLATVQLRLAHVSEQTEAGRTRQVDCEVEALAFGDVATELTRHLASGTTGAGLTCRGFLDRKSARNPQLILHVTEFEIV